MWRWSFKTRIRFDPLSTFKYFSKIGFTAAIEIKRWKDTFLVFASSFYYQYYQHLKKKITTTKRFQKTWNNLCSNETVMLVETLTDEMTSNINSCNLCCNNLKPADSLMYAFTVIMHMFTLWTAIKQFRPGCIQQLVHIQNTWTREQITKTNKQ